MYCVIMAGGSGTRFWPRSREGKSKQFLPILGKNSLIESTIMRLRSLTSHKNIYIVAKKSQEEELLKHSGKIPLENIIYEPIILEHMELAALETSRNLFSWSQIVKRIVNEVYYQSL